MTGATDPYVGHLPFDRSRAALFHGRAADAHHVTALVRARRLVVIEGETAVGKSSLVQAGVLPALATEGADARLAAHVPPAGQDDQGLGNDGDEPDVVILDDLEGLFDGGPGRGEERGAFVRELGDALERAPRLRALLVTSLGDELVGEIGPLVERYGLGRFRLDGLTPDAAVQALVGPLRSTDRVWAPGAAEALVDRLRTATTTDAYGEQVTRVAPTVEPLTLQVVAAALWDALDDDVTTITIELVDALGGVGGALAAFVGQAVADVAVREGVPDPVLWEWLEAHLLTDRGTRRSVHEGVATTGGLPNSVARAFEAHRVLRASRSMDTIVFTLPDNAFINPVRRGALDAARLRMPDGRIHPATYLRMAEAALDQGELARASEYATQATRSAQGDARLLAAAETLLGRLALDRARLDPAADADTLYSDAERHYLSAAELYEVAQNSVAVGRVLASLGRLFMERGLPTEAISVLQSAVARLHGDLASQMDLARALLDAGQPQAAIAQYSLTLDSEPGAVEALVGRGSAHAERGDPDSALADLDNAVRLDPDLADRPDVVRVRTRARERLARRS